MARNIPNALTVLRILLVPVFLYFVAQGRLSTALIVFAAAGVTDALDGFIARAFDLRTELGGHLDPFADKLLLTSAFVALTFIGLVPAWLCAPVIAREALMLVAVAALRLSGRKVRPLPSVAGKATTALQVSTVLFVLFFRGRHAEAFLALAGATLALTVYSAVDYAWKEAKRQRGLEGT